VTGQITLPVWLFVLIVLFAAVTFASHFLFPSVRWFFRRRLERAVERLNRRLTRPIEPFKLARRHDMIQRLVYDPEVTQAIVEHARRNGVREDVSFETARRYAREIVPSFSAFAYFGLGTRLARWLVRALYGVKTGRRNTEIIESIDRDATVIFIMNHRSNMDYVLVTMLAARASALSYAVGEWARVWPLSRLIRSMGAYFIRRKSRGGLYRKVLARYVQMATAGGVTQAIFPEGGLSLDGALKPPKLGLLAYVTEGWDPEGRDLVFVPVAINYDRVLEDRILVSAGEAGNRRFRARMGVVFLFVLRMIWRRLWGTYRPFGTAAVVFGEPLALSHYGAQPDPETLGAELMRRIQAGMPLLSMPLMAKILLEAEAPIPEAELIARTEAAFRAAEDTAALEPVEDMGLRARRACERLARRKLILHSPEGWTANPEELPVLRYYANSIAHFFPPVPASPGPASPEPTALPKDNAQDGETSGDAASAK
jgi:glycerol-3-phosphate O-acyltransferase